MSYILLKNIHLPGYKECYAPVLVSDDLDKIKESMKKRVIDGSPVCDYKIVQDVPFEFKCAIKLTSEGESNDSH